MIAVATLLGCAAAVAWFARRARVGARVRAVAGSPTRAVDRLASLATRPATSRAVLGALAGVVVAGTTGAALGAVAGVCVDPLRRARDRRRRADAVDAALPDAMRTLAAGLRAGLSLPQTLEAARDETGGVLGEPLEDTVRRLDAGAPFDEALDSFAIGAGTPEAAALVETLRVGRSAGANLPVILDVAVAALEDRRRIERDRRAASAQARLSAVVIGVLPLAFFALVGSGARGQLALLFGDPVGWALLAGGLGLEAAGALWMRALVRR